MKHNVILFGPPGSGKGTQSSRLANRYQWVHVSTGELLRKEINAGSPLGKAAKDLIEKGRLVPDEVVIGMIASIVENNKDVPGFLFDGFPRTLGQAEALDRLLSFHKTTIHQVLFLQVNEEELIERLIGRARTSGRLDDANPEVQRKRQTVYKNETLPVCAHYEKVGKVEEIDGEGSIDEIYERLSRAVDASIAQMAIEQDVQEEE